MTDRPTPGHRAAEITLAGAGSQLSPAQRLRVAAALSNEICMDREAALSAAQLLEAADEVVATFEALRADLQFRMDRVEHYERWAGHMLICSAVTLTVIALIAASPI